MFARITKRWPAVRTGEVHPHTFQPGDVVSDAVDGLASLAIEVGAGVPCDGSAASVPASAGSDAPGAETAAPPMSPGVFAKTRMPVTCMDDSGQEIKLAKGVVVEGALALRLIDEGKAVPVPANKAATPPETA
jgi:hypothetical protein